MGIWLYFRSDDSQKPLRAREVATRYLAEHLARTFPKDKVLVVSNPFTLKDGQPQHIYLFEKAGVKGLRQGLGDTRLKIDYPKLQAGALKNPHEFIIPPEATTPVAWLLEDEAFSNLQRKHPDCGLMVSLIGMPPGLRKSEFWQDKDSPKLALLLPDLWMFGNPTTIASAFKSGRIAAAVLPKPGVSPEDSLKATKDFSSRFLLVTSENIDEMLGEYPQLFEPPELGPRY